MASRPIALTIKPRGKPIRSLPKEVSTTGNDTGAQLHAQIARLAKTSPARLRIQTEGGAVIQNNDSKLPADVLANGTTITVKDLGPQCAWRTVYIWEYLGPLLIHPIAYFLRPYLYKSPSITGVFPEPSTLQTLSMAMLTLHFIKREYETVFVHRFSAATMPFINLPRNAAYYWFLTGFNIAYWTYSPTSPTQNRPFSLTDPTVNPWASLGLVLYVVGEALNYNAHLVLRDLRPKGSTERGIPRGIGFNLVTCPNYMFELLSWTGIWLVNFSLSTGLFCAVALGLMSNWAKQRESKYRKQFPETYKKKRFVMVPGLV